MYNIEYKINKIRQDLIKIEKKIQKFPKLSEDDICQLIFFGLLANFFLWLAFQF